MRGSIGIVALLIAAAPPVAPDSANERAYRAANAAAMDRMMADMAVSPTGDVDRDFALMMIPHHQGAIDMAVAQLRYGRNERLRRIAQEIVVEQQEEIAAMRLAITALPKPGLKPAGSDQMAHHDHLMPMEH